jgi:AcrR family transcriptional regulator
MPKRDANYMSARREKIVDAALAVMNREGSAALSTPALCREAGISTGALYTHFKSKDDVYAAIAERALRRRQEDFDFHDAQELSARVTGLATICREPPEIEKMRIELQIFLSGQNDKWITSAFSQYAEGRELERSIARLVRVGELRSDLDPAAAAIAINGLIAGLRLLALLGSEHSAPFDRAIELLLSSMRKPEGT